MLLSDYLASSGFHGIDLVTGLVFILVVLRFRRGIWGTVRHQWLARALAPDVVAPQLAHDHHARRGRLSVPSRKILETKYRIS